MGYRARAVRAAQQMGLGVICTATGVGPSCVNNSNNNNNNNNIY